MRLSVAGSEWQLDFDAYADAACLAWTATVRIAGDYEIEGPAATVAGAFDARFGFSSKAVTPRDAGMLAALIAEPSCAASGPWSTGHPTDISGRGCSLLGQLPISTCAADYDLVSVDAGGVLRFGARPADNDLCTEARRPQALSDVTFTKDASAFSQELGALPAGNFLENLAIAPDGTIYMTSLNDRSVYQYTTAGGFVPYATNLPGGPVGIVREDDGNLYVTLAQPPSILRITPGRTVSTLVTVAGGGLLNGMQRLAPGVLLIADSRALRIWRVDVATAAVTVWKTDPSLERPPNTTAGLGPNGLQIHGGMVYVANPIRRTMIVIPIGAGGVAGEARTLDVGVSIDDFAVRSDGVIFATSHDRSLYRITPEGEVEIFANQADGIHGCTAAQFGRQPDDRDLLYVVGDGGYFWSQQDGRTVEPATLVRLDVRRRE